MGSCMSVSPPKDQQKNPPKKRKHLSIQQPYDSQGMDLQFTQKITVPSYFYPGCKDWADLIHGAPNVDIAIINPNSGPGKKIDPNYVTQTKSAQNAGIKILGYVHTSYGKRDLAVVQDEIEKFFNWYNVDGIFLDEIPIQRSFLHIYERLHDQIASHGGALTVLNPGVHPCEAYFDVADIVCNFEDGYHNYVSTYNTPEWVIQKHIPPEKIWHIVHSVPGPDQLKQVLSLSKARRAGHVFITSEKMPNPYGKLPEINFWQGSIKGITIPPAINITQTNNNNAT